MMLVSSLMLDICMCNAYYFLCGYRMWTEPEAKDLSRPTGTEAEKLKLIAEDCNTKSVSN